MWVLDELRRDDHDRRMAMSPALLGGVGFASRDTRMRSRLRYRGDGRLGIGRIGTMNLIRNEGLESIVLDAMRQGLESPARDGIHLTDLLNPRYAYWQQVEPKPVTTEEVLYFVAGRGHEAAVGRLHGFVADQSIVRDGIAAHADFYLSIPVEFKTRRGYLAQAGQELKHYTTYIEQTRGYAALYDRPAAWLWILSLVEPQDDGSTRPEFRCYELTWTPEELEAERTHLLERKVGLTKALTERNHRALPLCWAFKCGKQSRTRLRLPMCETCHREFQTDWGLGKHAASRPQHIVKQAVFAPLYLPKCKWYAACQPYLDDPDRGGPVPETREDLAGEDQAVIQ